MVDVKRRVALIANILYNLFMLKKVIFLPVGSCEYHGDILPAETDALIADKIAHALNEKLNNSILLPLISYGVSTEHSDFESTITAKNESYYAYMYHLLDSISYENAFIVIINGHGGNVNILKSIETEFNYLHQDKKVYVPAVYGKDVVEFCERTLGEYDAHAGSVESSLMSYYKYINVDDCIKYNDEFVKKMSGSLRFFRTGQVNPLGIIKDTNKLIVNSENGKQIHDLIVETLFTEVNDVMGHVNRIIN